MKIKKMGRTGLKVSEICLGTMTFGNQADQDTAFAIMDVADGAGVTFFDTADVYPLGGGTEKVGRTEEIVGQWLARARGARTHRAGDQVPGRNGTRRQRAGPVAQAHFTGLRGQPAPPANRLH